jgi:CheY-like chemotaxis protein
MRIAMMNSHSPTSLMVALPFARRFARAMVGSQQEGDALVARSLRQGLALGLPVHLALYAGIADLTADTAPQALSARERQATLLTSLEGLTRQEASQVLGLDDLTFDTILVTAHNKLRQTVCTDVLIIEDEPVIALDLRLLVTRCGHRVIGAASSEAEAIRIAAEHKPGLILADVNLGRGGDGITAVRQILRHITIPVIFVTAYAERLLTAEGVEPAFIISKPFDRMTLAIATYQAITAGHIPAV